MDSQQSCPPTAVWQEILEANWLGEFPADLGRHLDSCCHCQTVVEALMDQDRAWLDIAAGLRRPDAPLPEACQQVLNDLLCGPIGHGTISENVNHSHERKTKMPACIHIERMMHRASVAVTDDTAAAYTLVKLIPTGQLTAKPMGLNLALALDVSGSMYEEDGTGASRLKRVQDAAVDAIHKLKPQDTLAIIAFAHNARVLLPSTPIAEKDKIEDVIRRIDTFDVDPGGTAMDEGLALALSDVEKHAGPGKLSQVLVLTDGETSGEQNCRTLAQQAAAKNIHLTLMGVGLDWKASLIKDLAQLSQGKWHYIDVQQAQETTRIFAKEFQTLAAAGFLDVKMRLTPMKDVRIKRLRQVVPEIKEVALEEPGERNLVAKLGTLQHDLPTRYILDLSLPKRADGKYVIAHLELTYDLGTGRRESSGPIPLEMSYTAAGNGYVNAEVMKHIDDIQLKEMSDTLQIALQNNDNQAARMLAQDIANKGKAMGPAAAKKTQLALQLLDELNENGLVRRKTVVSLENEARVALVEPTAG